MKKKITIEFDDEDYGINTGTLVNEGTWPYLNHHYYDPCANCPNNPANNPYASGFCNCVLPYMNGTKWQVTSTYTTDGIIN